MRLIDAEVVKEFFRENLILPHEGHKKIVETMIDAIPAAYDVEKVVEELKKIETCGDCRNNCEYYDWSVGACEGHCEDYVRGRAIEIVKQGVVGKDVE